MEPVSDWKILDVVEDLGAGDGPRLLITYSVPTKHAPDGVYSYSFPKDSFNVYAAVYGYDVNDEQDRQDLFDHVIHQAYLNTVLAEQDADDEFLKHPRKVGRARAKQVAKDRLTEHRAVLPVAAPADEAGAGSARLGLKANLSTDVMQHLRSHMDAALSTSRIRDVKDVVEGRRRVF